MTSSSVTPLTVSAETALRLAPFPLRLTAETLLSLYPSLEAAFTAHDHLYVARMGRDNPELFGCALLLLGNRVGGERIIDKAQIETARSCFYRAYAAWQDDDMDGAQRWLAKARVLHPGDPRYDRLHALMQQRHFDIVYQVNFSEEDELQPFRDLPDVTVTFVRPSNQTTPVQLPLSEQLPPGLKPDLILLDNLTFVPVGVGELGAPVVAGIHDSEYDHDYLDQVLPEIDLLSVGSTTEMVELARPFHRDATAYFYPIPLRLPRDDRRSVAGRFADQSGHIKDIVHTGSIAADFYRHKRQEILALNDLDEKFSVEILGTRFSIERYWQLMRQARFSLMSSRYCNSIPTRTFDALLCGTLALVDAENGFPYLFSELFACFPLYHRETLRVDIENHLNNYDAIIATFKAQLPRFEAEFNSLFPDDATRTRRYLRHLLFMTQVEYKKDHPSARTPSLRRQVYFNEYDFLFLPAATLAQLYDQTPHHHYLRRALMAGRIALAQHKTRPQSVTAIKAIVEQGLSVETRSLALQYMRGLCQRFLGDDREAASTFQKLTDRPFTFSLGDPTVNRFGRHHSHYWIADARVRTLCAEYVPPLIPVEDVFKSYAYANLADIALKEALAADDDTQSAITGFKATLDLARQSLHHLIYNDSAERSYLRACFGLALRDSGNWDTLFLQSFAIARANDVLVLHDMAAMALHLHMRAGHSVEAEKLRADVRRFTKRTDLLPYEFTLYPEAVPFHSRYQISHKHLDEQYSVRAL